MSFYYAPLAALPLPLNVVDLSLEFGYFNNIALSLRKIRKSGLIEIGLKSKLAQQTKDSFMNVFKIFSQLHGSC